MSNLKLLRIPANVPPPPAAGSIETISIPQTHFDFLLSVSHEMNPRMPGGIGGAHVIRALLERLEEAGADAAAIAAVIDDQY